jgi:phosphoenolpyruvate carboxykinase (ATP)
MYHFMSGYTAKVAGTEVGVTEPEATFSACFGAAFMVWHPSKYAEMLAEKMRIHGAKAWLINTGLTGGSYGTGKRMTLAYTRAIIDAIHDGSLDEIETTTDPVFGVEIPKSCPNVPSDILIPRHTWERASVYDETARTLAGLFRKNFVQFEEGSPAEVLEVASSI